MRFETSFNQLAAWVITVVVNQISDLSHFLTLMTILTKTEKLKGVIQQLKVFGLGLRQFDVLYWARFQNKCLPTVNTSQMMMIPIHRAIECFPCWEVSASHQSFLLKSTKMSINCSQSHIRRGFDQCAMKFLATNLISTIIQCPQDLLLSGLKIRVFIDHPLKLPSQAFVNISPLVP